MLHVEAPRSHVNRGATVRQIECLAYIAAQQRVLGHAPSYREIGDVLRVSWQRASELVHQLCSKGLLENEHGRGRARRLTADGREALAARRWRFIAVEELAAE